MKKDKLENILERLLSTGADFAEVFVEKKETKVYNYVNKSLDSFKINNSSGLGLRIALGTNTYYAALNDFTTRGINETIDKLKSNIHDKVKYDYVALDRLGKYGNLVASSYTEQDIKNKLASIDALVRSKDKRINQVNITFQNTVQNVVIANYIGIYKKEIRERTRLFITVNFVSGQKRASVSYSKGLAMNCDLLDTIDYEKEIDSLVKMGIDKLEAVPFVGQVMPVIIESGFGGVIFHEACGHAMEATSVADGLSVLSHDLGKMVASPKVTIIDDGTISSEWGTTKIDDEGNPTQKNILISKGVLKSYLVDELNTRKMDMDITGSGRRESYLYAPTSRMNNTYLESGTDTLEDMLKDIKLGLYCAKMGGGSVSPETGDFNFACDVAYMIRDGKIAEPVKSASLIGNTKEILKEVTMVGDNLELGQGMCGSISGYVPVNVGMPRIKVGHILVGGEL